MTSEKAGMCIHSFTQRLMGKQKLNEYADQIYPGITQMNASQVNMQKLQCQGNLCSPSEPRSASILKR